jgi:hypothetical protein
MLKINFGDTLTQSSEEIVAQSQRKSEEMQISADRSNWLRYLSKGSESKYIFTSPLS